MCDEEKPRRIGREEFDDLVLLGAILRMTHAKRITRLSQIMGPSHFVNWYVKVKTRNPKP